MWTLSMFSFFFSSRRRHTRFDCDWSSDVCSSDLMDKLPETAFVHTFSNDAQVTDSAPSMAAYMTGVKMNNEVISMTPDTKATDAAGKAYHTNYDSTCPSGNGQAVPTLLEQMKSAGYGTGVVST